MIPVTLVGENLGARHRYLNTAVNVAYGTQLDFGSLDNIPEQSPVDRIFKINLASKHRNVAYILKNLKDDDMLYVSKALKCKWLLESAYVDIINPEYLEECLFQSMITTAVTKMKKWVFLNLKDPVRCQNFFLYYCDSNYKLAVKFLRNCTADFITEQFPKQIHKMSAHDFKFFCEKNSLIARTFFDALLTDEALIKKFLSDEKRYFETLKSLLKSNGTMVLDITEKYFNKQKIRRFNSEATKYIMKHHRARFIEKPELYTAFLLDFKTLASCLTAEEAMELTLTLARDHYLKSVNWFNYKQIEPLIKRISPKDRNAFKKKVFVDKDVGTVVQKWPYEMPSPPRLATKVYPIFDDYEHHLKEYNELDFRAMLKKRKFAKWGPTKTKTMLDKLFDEYRFLNYDRTLYELRKKLKAESSPQNREYMILVLVSKSGGCEKNLVSLMQLLDAYKNEPSQWRAAVVRSLVKRARVWRVPDDTWNQLLGFSHGLGLDGNSPEAKCIEGIHAVVIREILVSGTCDSKIFDIYFKNFSNLKQYSLTADETNVISNIIPKLLYAKAFEDVFVEENIRCTEYIIGILLDALTAFGLSIEKYPGLVTNINKLAKAHILQMDRILTRLFRSRIARRELFEVNFSIITTEKSYLNALRHDVNVISIEKLVKLILLPKSNYQRFLNKVSIYFSEKDGIATQILNVLKTEPYNKVLAGPLVLLLRDDLASYMKDVDSSTTDINGRLLAAALRANAHLARPAFNIDDFGWSAVGTKAIANKVLVCRNAQVNNYFQKLVQNKQTVKLAYSLAKRSSKSDLSYSFTVLSKFKPTLAIKMGFKILTHEKVSLDDANIWGIIKPLIEYPKIISGFKKNNKLPEVSRIPVEIRPAYAVICYKMAKEISFYKSMPFLCAIENILPSVTKEFIESIIVEYLNDGLPKIPDEYPDNFDVDCNCMFIRIIIKYLLLCKTEESQKKKQELIGVSFLNKMQTLLLSIKNEERSRCRYLDEFLGAFRYHKVFLNKEYVSCMPVMTEALTWMKQNLPLEVNFKRFVHMHLNMIYSKAITNSIDMLPNHCIDDNNQMEARSMVGNLFGKYMAQEINALKTSYFDSIQYMYKNVIVNLKASFLHSCEIFTKSLIDGVLDASEATDNNVLAVYLFAERSRLLGTTSREHILLRLRKCENIETQMIFFDEMQTAFFHYY